MKPILVLTLLIAIAQSLYVGPFGLVYQDASVVLCAEGSNITGLLAAQLCEQATPPSFFAVAASNFASIVNFSFVSVDASLGCVPGNCTQQTIDGAAIEQLNCSWLVSVDCSINCSATIDSNGLLTVGGGVVCGDNLSSVSSLKRAACATKFPDLLSEDFTASITVLPPPSTSPWYSAVRRPMQFQEGIQSFCENGINIPGSSVCTAGPVNVSCVIKEDNESIAMLTPEGIVQVGSPTTIICADSTYFRSSMAAVLCSDRGFTGILSPQFKPVPINQIFSPLSADALSFKYFNETCQTQECTAGQMFQNSNNYNSDCDNVLVVECSKSCGVSRSQWLATLGDSFLCADIDVAVLLDTFCAVNGSNSNYFAKTLLGPSPATFGVPFTQLSAPFRLLTGTSQDFTDYCYTAAQLTPNPCETSVIFTCQLAIDCSATINPETSLLQIEPGTAFSYETTYFDDQMRDTFCKTQIGSFPKAAIFPRVIAHENEVVQWYGVSPTGCEYVVCDGKKVCNLAFTASPNSEALGVNCNVSFEYKLNLESTALLVPPDWNGSAYVGVLAARPHLTNTDNPWTAMTAVSSAAFTDGVALLFCRRLFPNEHFTSADALRSYGSTLPVEIVKLSCQLPQPFPDEPDPLNNESLCSFGFVQKPFYTDYQPGDSHSAIGIHCGSSNCNRYSRYEIVGVFCGVGQFSGRNVWLSVLPNETSIMYLLNATRQPWEQIPLDSVLFNLTGHNCRLEPWNSTDWSCPTWKNFFKLKTERMVEVTLIERAQPSGFGVVTAIVVSFGNEQEFFMSCNSCPNTSPDGSYCGAGLYTLRHDSVTNADVFDYSTSPEDPTPACSGIPFTVSSSLPRPDCALHYKSSLCPSLINQHIFSLSFSVEHSTLYELGSSGEIVSKPYVLCAKPDLISCPARINNSYCGVGIYSNASLRVIFSDDGTVSILFDDTMEECREMAYTIRPIARSVGCIVDIPALTEYSSCLAKSALFGKAQGKQPVILSADETELKFNFLDDTVYLTKCRTCEPNFDGTYCAVHGTHIVRFINKKEYTMTVYKTGEIFDAQMDSDPNVCGQVFYQPNTYMGPRETLPPSFMPNRTNTWSVLGVFEASFIPDEFILLTPEEFVSVHAPGSGKKASETGIAFRLCASLHMKRMRYCPVGALNFEFLVIDDLHMEFFLPGGKVINSSYILGTNHLISVTDDVALAQLVEEYPVFNLMKYSAYAETENGPEVLMLINNFGYSRFVACKKSSAITIVLYVIIGAAGLLFLIYIIKVNVAKLSSIKSLKELQEDKEFLKSLESVNAADVELHELKELQELRRRNEYEDDEDES